jgi:hypothetical protein
MQLRGGGTSDFNGVVWDGDGLCGGDGNGFARVGLVGLFGVESGEVSGLCVE